MTRTRRALSAAGIVLDAPEGWRGSRGQAYFPLRQVPLCRGSSGSCWCRAVLDPAFYLLEYFNWCFWVRGGDMISYSVWCYQVWILIACRRESLGFALLCFF